MQGNDISSDFQPCLLVVFEGLLGLPPREGSRKRRWGTLWKKLDAGSQITTYTMNTLLLAQIRRVPYPVEVVTFLGPQFVQPIEKRLEDLHALVRRVWYTTPEELARIHLVLPDVAGIFDPDASRAFATYGSLGRHLLPENAPTFGEQ